MAPTIEFWCEAMWEGEKTQHCVARIETEAPPPPVGAIINIRRKDYEVIRVDYTIDRAGELHQTYRRNVYLKASA